MTRAPSRSPDKTPSTLQKQPLASPSVLRPAFLVGELAKRWRVTETHIAGLIEEGSLRAINVAGRGASRKCLRVPADEVERFEQEKSTSPTITGQPGGRL